jgi:hypothetical protein
MFDWWGYSAKCTELCRAQYYTTEEKKRKIRGPVTGETMIPQCDVTSPSPEQRHITVAVALPDAIMN